MPQCNRAEIQYDPSDHTCPALNLVSCVQKIKINSNGTIGNVRLNQSMNCGNQFPPKDGAGGGDGDGSNVPCNENEDCPDGELCTDKLCKKNTSNTKMIIIIIIIVIFLLSCLGTGYYMLS
jgi:hypothetical protein